VISSVITNFHGQVPVDHLDRELLVVERGEVGQVHAEVWLVHRRDLGLGALPARVEQQAVDLRLEAGPRSLAPGLRVVQDHEIAVRPRVGPGAVGAVVAERERLGVQAGVLFGVEDRHLSVEQIRVGKAGGHGELRDRRQRALDRLGREHPRVAGAAAVHPHGQELRVVHRRAVEALGSGPVRVERIVARAPEPHPVALGAPVQRRDAVSSGIHGIAVGEGVAHLERLQQALLYKGLKRLLRGDLDHGPQDIRARVAVLEVRARLEVRPALAGHVRDHPQAPVLVVHLLHHGQRQAAAMGEDVPDGDAPRRVVVEGGQVLRDRVVDPQPALVDEDLRRRPREALGHRADVADRVLGPGHFLLTVANPERLVKDEMAVLDDGQLGTQDRVLLDVPADDVGEGLERLRADAVALRVGGGEAGVRRRLNRQRGRDKDGGRPVACERVHGWHPVVTGPRRSGHGAPQHKRAQSSQERQAEKDKE
jgi:hypothetical protein